MPKARIVIDVDSDTFEYLVQYEPPGVSPQAVGGLLMDIGRQMNSGASTTDPFNQRPRDCDQ